MTFGPPRIAVKSIWEVAPTALDELALWLETRGLRQSMSSLLGYGDLMRTSTSVYTAYTPTWTSAAPAPAIGNSTVTGRYIRLGKHVHCYGSITFGNTATFGGIQYQFSLPVTAASSAVTIAGSMSLLDASTGNYGGIGCALLNASSLGGVYGATYLGTASFVGVTLPWTWAQSDQIAWNISYEAA